MTDIAKQNAAQAALPYVKEGMVLGLGTGSTIAFFIKALGEKVRAGLDVKAIPTSEASAQLAQAAGIELFIPDETTTIDLVVDGADEVEPGGAMIKGGGGALLREKIIAQAAEHFVMIADQSKDVSHLGAFALPIEIDPFGWALTVRHIRDILHHQGFEGFSLDLRAAPEGGSLLSDGGHYIIDAQLGRIQDPAKLDLALTMVPGVVTTGLFIDIAKTLIFGTQEGAETRHV
ncbi:MAG: ribose-5-phosphate isomerase RpiA [Pseudomonadota bacterium]